MHGLYFLLNWLHDEYNNLYIRPQKFDFLIINIGLNTKIIEYGVFILFFFG